MKTHTDYLLATTSFRDRRVLVVGLGRFQGGVAVSRWLAEQGARLTITDQAAADTLQSSLASLEDLDINMQLGSHDPNILANIDLAIINPAVNKHRSTFFTEIIKRDIAWTTEINLFCQRCPATVIGVTGTFGKSTTSAMLAHVLSHQRVAPHTPFTNIHLGGNIGRSLLPQLTEMRPSDLVVLELSSAQLEDLPAIPWQPDVAIIMNLSPQHLDRHQTFEKYALAKRNILGDGNIKKGIVIGPLDEEAEALFMQKLSASNNHIIHPTMPAEAIKLRIPGYHNQANASTVLAACQLLGIKDTPARQALATFQGLPHRLEHVGTIDGADYYNDSKSTALKATISAVQSLNGPIIAIVGGQRKSQPLDEWAAIMANRCRAIICIGESGGDFAQAIRKQCALLNEPRAKYNPDTSGARADTPQDQTAQSSNPRKMNSPINVEQQPLNCAVQEFDAMDEALSYARKVAGPGDAVLFSPGAASFDKFNNYEHRGDVFVESFRKWL